MNYQNEELPEPEDYLSLGDGINISANYANEEVIKNCKRLGKKVGVWFRVRDFKESEEFYERMLKLDVDFICSDFPIRAMEVREKYLESHL
jgi:glycerophosphoryl diester phosphodiesterase